jgi:protein-tyrosine phosphatase
MVDIHSHILWGLDDGAKTFEESVAMAQMAADRGTTDIVATPHADDHFTYNPELVTARIAELRAALKDKIRIHRGCDFHLSANNIQAALVNPQEYTINEGPYLLVEFSEVFIPPTTTDLFRDFLSVGTVPIITHPERNPVLQKRTDLLESWLDLGCLIQVTALSLSDRFGRRAQDATSHLLARNMVQIIASDGHDLEHRPPRLDQAREELTTRFGSQFADTVLEHNPRAVLNGDIVERQTAQPASRLKRVFSFWSRRSRHNS